MEADAKLHRLGVAPRLDGAVPYSLYRGRNVCSRRADAEEYAICQRARHAQGPRPAGSDPDRHRPVVRQMHRPRRADFQRLASEQTLDHPRGVFELCHARRLQARDRTAVSPMPRLRIVRPGASSSIVAIDEAVTLGCLVTGLAMNGLICRRSVAAAAAASKT